MNRTQKAFLDMERTEVAVDLATTMGQLIA